MGERTGQKKETEGTELINGKVRKRWKKPRMAIVPTTFLNI